MDNAAVRSVLTYPEDDDLHDQHSYLPFKRISPETKVIALEHWGEKQEVSGSFLTELTLHLHSYDRLTDGENWLFLFGCQTIKKKKQESNSLEKLGIKKVDKEEHWSKSDTSSATHSKSL